MIWMINTTKKERDSGYPCGRLNPSTVRRRRWPDAGSRLDPPAFERAQALTLADRGSANFGEGLRHMREALTFAQPAPLVSPSAAMLPCASLWAAVCDPHGIPPSDGV
eukprot:scaffold22174_cov61-Phaeocystis_antarctica.AAC.1